MTMQQDVQRRLTTAFIKRAPVTITPTGTTEESDGTGGTRRVVDPADRDAIIVTLVEPSNSGALLPTYNGQGFDSSLQFELVGEWDADIRDEDRFYAGGHHYRVDRMMVENDYERRALVTRID